MCTARQENVMKAEMKTALIAGGSGERAKAAAGEGVGTKTEPEKSADFVERLQESRLRRLRQLATAGNQVDMHAVLRPSTLPDPAVG